MICNKNERTILLEMGWLVGRFRGTIVRLRLQRVRPPVPWDGIDPRSGFVVSKASRSVSDKAGEEIEMPEMDIFSRSMTDGGGKT